MAVDNTILRSERETVLNSRTRLAYIVALLVGGLWPAAPSSAVIDVGSSGAKHLNATPATRVNLSELRDDASSENIALEDGDTVFVLRAKH